MLGFSMPTKCWIWIWTSLDSEWEDVFGIVLIPAAEVMLIMVAGLESPTNLRKSWVIRNVPLMNKEKEIVDGGFLLEELKGNFGKSQFET